MLFLTPTELRELTERSRKAAQIAWLKRNGFSFVVGANGHARVLREHVQSRLSGLALPAGRNGGFEPNWGAI